MAISDDLNSIRTHLEDDYTALEQLGVSVEDKNIENIKDMANQIYAKFPKTSYAEGSNITLSNTLKGKLDFEDGIVGYGDTKQDTTQGYNLIDINSGTASTLVGVASSISGDIVTLNGSRNDGSTSNAVRIINEINRFNITTSDTYKMSLNVISGTYTGRVGLTFLNSSGTTLAYIETATNGTTANKSLTFSEQVSKISFFFNGEFSATNFKFQIMLQKGTSDINYEKYTGGIPSPNPDYKQDVKVVRGKNVVDWTNVNYTGQNGATITRTGSEYSVTSAGQFAFAQFSQEDLKLKPNTNYVFRAKIKSTETSNGSVIRVNPLMTVTGSEIYSSRTTSGNIAKIAFTTPSTIPSNAAVGLYPYEVSKTTVFTDIMICEGTDVNTSYLPYNTLEVVARGKNAFAFETNSTKTWYGLDITMNNSSVTINGTSTNTSSVYAYGFNLKPLKLIGTYKLSGYTRNDSYLQLYWKDKNGNIKYKEMKNNPTITFDEGDYLFQLFIFASSGTIMTFNNETFNLQLEEGSTATPYTPHQEQIKQLSLGNFKPSKIGNYKDYFYRTYGKNIFDNSVERKNAYIGASGSDIGTAITYYNSSATYSYVNCAYVEAGKTYTLSWKQSTTPASTNLRVGAIVDNNNIILNTQNTWTNSSTSITFTPNVSGYLVLCTDINATNIQIELGNTATDYNPYGSGEWYFKGKINNKELNGSETWALDTTYNRFASTTTITDYDISNRTSALCSHYKYNGTPYFALSGSGNYLFFGFPNENTTTLETWEAWLSTNKPSVFYIKAIPTDTPIPDGTLKTQLEEIYNIISVNGTTKLEIDGDLPLVMKVRALKAS